MNEELEALSEIKKGIRHRKYRKAFVTIDRMLDKQSHFYAKEALTLLLLQVTLVAKLLLKNVFKRQPYEFSFTRTLMWRLMRNLAVLENLLMEEVKPEMSIHSLLKKDANEPVEQEVAALLEKITLQAVGNLHEHMNSYLQALLLSCFSLCLSFKQYGRWREAFQCIKLGASLGAWVKVTKNPRILQRIIEIKLHYAAFLNELREYELSLQSTDEALLHIVDLFCCKYSLRELKHRKQQYQHERLWKQVIVCLCLNIDSLSCTGQYDRLHETTGFLEWAQRQCNIDSYAFKKCVHILTEEPQKMLERYIETADQLRRIASFYFQHLGKPSKKGDEPSIVKHFSELMYDKYREERLDRKVIAIYQPPPKQKQQKLQRRNKRSCHAAVSNHLEEDECMTAMEQDLFQHLRGRSPFRESSCQLPAKSLARTGPSSTDIKPTNFLLQFQLQRLSRTPEHSISPLNKSRLENVDKLVHADEIFFKRYIQKHSGLAIPSKSPASLPNSDRDKKHYCFVKKQFKMRNKENVDDPSDSFLNLTQEKRKIKQEGEFVFLLQKPAEIHCNNYVKKDEHGVEVPLSGVKLFVEIILENRGVLNLNKLFEKHQQVKKKRESQFKQKKKNQEKERLKLMYRLEETKRGGEEQAVCLRLTDMRGKRRAKVYKQSPVCEKLRIQVDGSSCTQQMISRSKQIAHESQKSQQLIKKFSQKIQEQLREKTQNPPRKLKRGGMLDQRFSQLRQSIAMERMGSILPTHNYQ